MQCSRGSGVGSGSRPVFPRSWWYLLPLLYYAQPTLPLPQVVGPTCHNTFITTHFSSANPGSTCPCAVCARSSTVLVTNAMHSNMHNALQKSTLFFTKSDTQENIAAYSSAHFWCSAILSIPRDRNGFPSSNGNIQE